MAALAGCIRGEKRICHKYIAGGIYEAVEDDQLEGRKEGRKKINMQKTRGMTGSSEGNKEKEKKKRKK